MTEGFPRRTIMHIDMDAFYPSVEVKVKPQLKGLPIIVGADPKGGRGRGVVTSCSYEARKFGVRSGMPISRAYSLCPQAVYLEPNFQLYEEVSERVMEILRKYADKLEQVSIDEAFLEVTGKIKEYATVEGLVRAIKEEVMIAESLTCSVGVAPNKSVAKIASDMHKPNGLTIVTTAEVKQFLEPLPVGKITGVGKKSEQALHGLGIKTIGDLAKHPARKLVEMLGKNGVWLWAVANGLEELEVVESYPTRSIGAEKTYDEDVEDWNVVFETVQALTENVHSRLKAANFLFKTVGVKIRFENFATFTRMKTHSTYMDAGDVILETVHQLLAEFRKDPRKVRLVGVRVSSLKRAAGGQTDLAAWSSADSSSTHK